MPRREKKRVRLTRQTVGALKCAGSSPVDLFDTEIRGFHVRAWPSDSDLKGRKSFRLKYVFNRRQRIVTLCEYGPKTAEEARSIALKHRAMIGDNIDPLEHRKERAERAARERADAETISELFERWMRDGPASNIRKRASSWQTNARHFRNHILPLLGNVLVKSLSVARVEQAQKDIIEGKTKRDLKTKAKGRSRVRGGRHVARAALLSLSAMLAWYARENRAYLNPVANVIMTKPSRRRTRMTTQQTRKLLQQMDAEVRNGVLAPVWSDVIQLLIFTGARKSEITGLKWIEVNFEAACIELASADRDKNDNLKDIALNGLSLALLRRRRNEQKLKRRETPWVFPSDSTDGPVVGVQKAWEGIRKRAGLEHIWLHDLRRTWATLAAEAGGAPATIAKALGHTQIETQRRYVHVEQEQALKLANKVGAVISGGRRTSEKP